MRLVITKHINISLILFCFMFILSLHCSHSVKKKEYLFANKNTISEKQHARSQSRIDKYKSYEIYFTLAKDVSCISVEINTKYIVETFTNKKRFTKTYFIVEKMLDISHFKNNKKYISSEIGRNFTLDWKRNKKIKICSKKNDPIKRLTRDNIYRVRYTTFSEYEYGFESLIIIHADCKVRYYRKMPETTNTL